MDPITQGALGAALALGVTGRRGPLSLASVAWLGAAGGMAADLDTLIRSPTDPLLAIEFHRHFTHSIAFIPVGGIGCAALYRAFEMLRDKVRPRPRLPLLAVTKVTTLGYATHAILDAFTTYGTLLFWPFTTYRVAWSWVSVIDLLFTLPLLGTVVWATRRRRPAVAWGALGYCSLYLLAGAYQQHRALGLQRQVALARGHSPERAVAFPTISNNVAWRGLYSFDGRIYVDKVRVPWFSTGCLSPGASVAVVPVPKSSGPVADRAERLLRWFARDWVAVDPGDPSVLGDLRYSFEPAGLAPIWGIRVLKVSDSVEWINNRSKRGIGLEDLRRLVFENGEDAICP